MWWNQFRNGIKSWFAFRKQWIRAQEDDIFYYWQGRWYNGINELREDVDALKRIDPKTWEFELQDAYGFDAYVKGRCAANCWIVTVTFLPLYLFHLVMMIFPLRWWCGGNWMMILYSIYTGL